MLSNREDSNEVIVLKFSEDDVAGLLLKYDIDDGGRMRYMEEEFIDAVRTYLPEYAMGEEERPMSQREYIPYIKEVAKTVMKIPEIVTICEYFDKGTPYSEWNPDILKKYERKGLFSELILHFILREFFGTNALISKIYFKDSFSHEAHGFDAVHVTEDGKLWLGETKFYKDCKGGMKELIDDLNNHFNHEYLTEQFTIINRALSHQNQKREEWINKIEKVKRLSEIFRLVMIPMLCIYEDDIPEKYLASLEAGLAADDLYCKHVIDCKTYFDSHNTFPNKNNVNTLLILLPVKSKDQIIVKMLEKITKMQGI